MYSALAVLAFFASTFAQNIEIISPSSDQLIRRDAFTVQVALPDSLSPQQSVSVVIGLQECGSKSCPVVDDDEILGAILYAGNFNPQRVNPIMAPYQNFTFNASSAVANPSGHATIHVAHLFLLGAGPSAVLNYQNVSVKFEQQ